jgi:hypothetical protein
VLEIRVNPSQWPADPQWLQSAKDEDEDVGDDADEQHDAGSRNAPVKDCAAPTM